MAFFDDTVRIVSRGFLWNAQLLADTARIAPDIGCCGGSGDR
jgi:hypothetical protein